MLGPTAGEALPALNEATWGSKNILQGTSDTATFVEVGKGCALTWPWHGAYPRLCPRCCRSGGLCMQLRIDGDDCQHALVVIPMHGVAFERPLSLGGHMWSGRQGFCREMGVCGRRAGSFARDGRSADDSRGRLRQGQPLRILRHGGGRSCTRLLAPHVWHRTDGAVGRSHIVVGMLRGAFRRRVRCVGIRSHLWPLERCLSTSSATCLGRSRSKPWRPPLRFASCAAMT